MKILVATNNENKLKEFKEILDIPGLELVSQKSAGLDIDVEETGETFAENAFLKADAAFKAGKMAAVADDSGLEVDCLGGEPGVRSARYTGDHNSSDLERNIFLLKKMSGKEQRSARFVCDICCILQNGQLINCKGVCEGTIAQEIVGENGFGYDSVFIPKGYDETMGQLSAEEKHRISHRGAALRRLAEKIKEYI